MGLSKEIGTICLCKLQIRFRTDYSVAGRGFHLRYYTLCNTVISGKQGGVIESPNFPRPYPHNRNCTWTIVAPRGNTLNLTFSHFEVEEGRNENGTCMYDFVDIKEEVRPCKKELDES